MPDAPDFTKIARDCIEAMRRTGADMDTDTADGVAEQLRLIWNLRGTCDIAAIDEVAHTNETAVEAAIERLNR